MGNTLEILLLLLASIFDSHAVRVGVAGDSRTLRVFYSSVLSDALNLGTISVLVERPT